MKIEEVIKKLEELAKEHPKIDVKLYATSCVSDFCGVTNYSYSWLRSVDYNKSDDYIVLSD
jgi:hypothetical protein